MTPASHSIGYDRATQMLLKGDFISPEQCYNDSAYLLLLWSDKELFVQGVYEAIKHNK